MSNINVIPLWENPEVQELNRLPMRSPLMPFASAKEALTDALAGPEHRRPENNGFYFGLDAALPNSPWKFKLLDNPGNDDLLWTKPDSAAITASWAGISVPGTWARQGG
ncbi:MAG: hypothetical protein LBH43_18740, partial [Treponema sp.]|nr:hypothetical protein [Treponema sp.]